MSFLREKFNYSLSINGWFLTHHFEKYTQGEVKTDDIKNGDFFLARNGDPLNTVHYVSF